MPKMNKNNIFESIEASKTGFSMWAGSVFIIILVRNLLESMVHTHRLGFSANFDDSLLRYFFHYPAFYVAQVLFITLLMHFITRERVERVARVVCSCFIVICLVPVLDAIISGGEGYRIGYFRNYGHLLNTLVNAFNPAVSIDSVSPGMRIELALCVIAAGAYTWVKTHRVWKTIIGVLAVYLGIPLFAGALPMMFAKLAMPFATAPSTMKTSAVTRLITSKGLTESVDQPMAIIYLVMLVICLAVFYYLYDRRKFFALTGCIRPFRSIHYCGLLCVGLGAGYYSVPGTHAYAFKSPLDYLAALALIMGLILLGMSAAIVNDLFDFKGDSMSNPERPLVRGQFDRSEYWAIGIVLLILSLGFAYCACYQSFLMFLTLWGVYFIYSAPPFRLKRFFPVNMMLIVLNGFLAFLAGFAIFARWNTFLLLSWKTVFVLTVPYLLGVHIITLKDYEADTADRIGTLPTILGERKSRILMALMLFIAAVSIVPVLGIRWLYIPGVVFGAMAALLVMREQWNEKLFFIHYLCYFLLVATVCLRANI